jgi:hypothetical protein
LNLLDETTVEQDKIEEISDFLKQKLNMQIYNSFEALNLKDKISAVKSLLNRPIRVCGMVKKRGTWRRSLLGYYSE